jgi:hypothetical protein
MMLSPKDKTILPARSSGPRPGDFPVGSLESRAAARAMLKRCDITTVMISTGLPSSFGGPPIVDPPDRVAYYLAPDDSIVQVICREYERGKFTAFIDQTWSDGSVYEGNYRVTDYTDLEKFCRPTRERKLTK